MEDAGFIIGSYVVTFAGIGAYAWYVLRRARKVDVPAARRGQALDLRPALARHR